MKFLPVVLGAIVAAATKTKWSDEFIQDIAKFNELNHKDIFQQWALNFGKVYTGTEEESHRYMVWLDNYFNILKHNHNPTRENFTLKLNQFGDMTGDEFRVYVHGHSGSCVKKGNKAKISALSSKSNKVKVSDNPTTVDWREKNVVTPVKDQGSCGSCWAFSATGSTECEYAIKNSVLNSLSEQELVDCSDSYGNDGCNGGLMDDAFKYIEAKDGLCSETEYPYKGVDGVCESSKCTTRYNPISDYTDVTKDDADALETATVSGCVSVAIEADQFAFQYYSSGVLTGTCGTSLDHGVLVVGYDDTASTHYWIVKNSWGTSWGVDGYVYICKDCDKNGNKGECGINMEPSYPVAK